MKANRRGFLKAFAATVAVAPAVPIVAVVEGAATKEPKDAKSDIFRCLKTSSRIGISVEPIDRKTLIQGWRDGWQLLYVVDANSGAHFWLPRNNFTKLRLIELPKDERMDWDEYLVVAGSKDEIAVIDVI